MKCIDSKENLNALLDGEIENSRISELKTHLETCASCRTEYESLRAVGESLRQNRRVSAPVALDEKVLSAFQTFHREKRGEKAEKAGKAQTGKFGWFGVPRLAFAAAFVLFALATLPAFQLGRMSAEKSEIPIAEMTRDETTNAVTNAAPENKQTAQIQIVEVPVIKERIVEIPVVREKIITRVVYKNVSDKDEKALDRQNAVPENDETDQLTVKSRLRDNQYSTQMNLEGFQLVSDLKPQIIKGENNEK